MRQVSLKSVSMVTPSICTPTFPISRIQPLPARQHCFSSAGARPKLFGEQCNPASYSVLEANFLHMVDNCHLLKRSPWFSVHTYALWLHTGIYQAMIQSSD
ncbi:hypothetical protein KIL84_010357 [Mauremys mutica]|uniref:Uncharacterized protein n=1 Tax=Mauremys mutica TaxID=74926 RepID=A0A9D4B1F6_9SAUR|nr:hypothetical protein KIL84_010357 [Mauremys mutica]